MVTVFLRTVMIYVILVAAMRLMGKRQIGELQISELVVTLMLSELAVMPISDRDIPVSHAVIPILLLLSLEVISSFAQTKSLKLKKLFSGESTLLISHGKLDRNALAKNRIELEELLGELRLCGAFDISDVQYAYLEENGKLSVLLRESSSAVTPEQLGMQVREKGIAHAVIVDGRLTDTGLADAGRDERWLDGFLSKAGVEREDVFLLTVDDSGGVNLLVSDEDSPSGISIQKHFPPARDGQTEKK